MTGPVYLDYNATAPLKPAVLDAMRAALADTGNPSSVHRFGRLARRRVEEARAAVAALVGARPAQVVFTSGGTEANNLALAQPAARVLISATEHDSVRAAAPAATLVPVDRAGVVDLAALDRLLAGSPAPALVAVMLANNETGVIQPIADVARIVRARDARIHCDAVQAAGRIAVDFAALGVHTMTISAHKFGGPQGIGALIVDDEVALSPMLRGGGQERGSRAGTENVAGIVGFGLAARLAHDELATMSELTALRDAMEARLEATATIFGREAPRLANTSCVAMPGVAAETQVMAFDLAGVALSAGAACSSGKVRASHVLQAMGAGDLAGEAIRASLGWATTQADVDRFVETWIGLWARLGGRAGAAERGASAAPAA